MGWMGASLLVWALAAAAPQSVGAEEDEEPGALNAVVVTAGGRTERAGETVVNVLAHERSAIERRSLTRLDDVALQSPGLSFVRTAFGATTQISIRGLNSRVGASTIGLYVDDTPIQIRSLGFTATNPLPALYDLDRVEVLRGPQGTLYGSGAEGGAVRFITPDAPLAGQTLGMKLEAGGLRGGGSSYEAGAAAGAALVEDRVGGRIALWVRREGGYIDHVDRESGALRMRNANREEARMARAAFAFALTPRLTLSPKLEFLDRRLKDSNVYWEAYSDPAAGRFANAAQVPQPDRDRFVLPAVKLVWRGDGVLVTVSASRFNRVDRSVVDYSTFIPATYGPPVVPGLPGYVAYADMANKQTGRSEEIRLQSNRPGARIEWLVGAYHGEMRQRAIQAVTDPQADALAFALFRRSLKQAAGEDLIDGRYSFLLDNRTRDQQLAAFGEARARLTRTLSLIAGVRVARTRFEFDGRQSGAYAGGVVGGHGVLEQHPATPRFGLSWRARPNALVYATAAKGFRIGGVNPPAPAVRCAGDLAALGLSRAPETFDSDQAWSYEGGLKTALLDRRLSLQSSAYWTDWSNIQQPVSLPGCGFLYTDNLGSAVSRGFDLQLEARPTDALTLTAGVAYVDARYRATVFGGVVDRASGRRAVIVDEGDRLGARPWTLSLSGEYRFQAFGRAPAYLRADYQYLGPQALPTPITNPRTAGYDPDLPGLPEAHALSARLGARVGKLDLSLFVDNLLDTAPRLLRAHDNKGSPLYAGATLPPRMVGATAAYAF